MAVPARSPPEVRRSILLFFGAFSRRSVLGVSIIAATNGSLEVLGRALALELAPVQVNVVSSNRSKARTLMLGCRSRPG